jgi:pyrimidine-nucleoside phosphorylase
MSKKISEGIQGLVLDIKRGNGAFLETKEEGEKLGELLSLIGSKFNLDVKYISTDMSQPLGSFAGLRCEIIESMDTLKGNGPDDLMQVVLEVGEVACSLAKITNYKDKIMEVINNGRAYEIFDKMVFAHGGNINNLNLKYTDSVDIIAKESGTFKFINTKKIGEAINFLNMLNGNKDVNAGAKFFKKNNDAINKGELVLKLFSNKRENLKIVEKLIFESFSIN